MWQEIIVFGCVAVALLFVLRKYLPTAPHRGRIAAGAAVSQEGRVVTGKAGASPCGACRACSGGGCH
jgi:hypothetical protein